MLVLKNTIKKKLEIPEIATMTTRYLLKYRLLVKYDLSIGMIKRVNYLKGVNQLFVFCSKRKRKDYQKAMRKYTRKEWFLLKDETQMRKKTSTYLWDFFYLACVIHLGDKVKKLNKTRSCLLGIRALIPYSCMYAYSSSFITLSKRDRGLYWSLYNREG